MTITHDPHAMRIAARIERQLAPTVIVARLAIERRIADVDGWPITSDDPHVRTSLGTSSTESAGARRAQLAADHRQVHEDLRELDDLVSRIIRSCRRMATGAEPVDDGPPIPLCMEGQSGKEGSIVWGDPMCAMPAVKSGMCQRHYDSWRRHRLTSGIDVSRDHEPAAW